MFRKMIRNDIVVRPGQPSDLDTVMALEEACFEPGVRESADVYDSRLKGFPDGFLIAEHVKLGLKLGYSTAERWAQRPIGEYEFTLNTKAHLKHDPTGSVYYISSLAILAEYRGQGIGEMLLSTSMDTARQLGCRQAVLIVGAAWNSAIRLYERLGFENVDLRNGFFQPIDCPAYDAIVMIKNLNSLV